MSHANLLEYQGVVITLPVSVRKRAGLFGPITPGEVLISRQSRWGNPFKVGEAGTREEVCLKYFLWLDTQPALLAQLEGLRGKTLVCHCAPELCHGHILGLKLWLRDQTAATQHAS